MKTRRTAPPKPPRPEAERPARTNRQRRREALELADRAAHRPVAYPAPEDDTGRYCP